jgi:ParB/RepB/Spo0J family partition protein
MFIPRRALSLPFLRQHFDRIIFPLFSRQSSEVVMVTTHRKGLKPMSSKETAAAVRHAPTARETAKEIPLTQILVDHNWNSRGMRWKEMANDEDTKFEGLVASIRARGLDEPVVVRPNPDPKNTKQPYALVYGFRRFEAVSQIAAEDKLKEPTILGVVRTLNENEARSLNIRENTVRNNLAVPDLAWAIFELGKAGNTDLGIAGEIGKTQGYVSMLHRIMKGVAVSVLNHWRQSIVPLTVSNMLTVLGAASEKDEKLTEKQTAKYTEMVKAQAEKARIKTDEEKAAAKVEGMKKKAHAFGFLLGQLDALGFLASSDVKFTDCITVVVPGCEELDARTKRTIAKSGETGWKDGQEAVEAANSADEEEEETEKE